ncbi:MAG: helix-turn-helix domain-containing protein [Candidatus Bathyarchaeia archaeon]
MDLILTSIYAILFTITSISLLIYFKRFRGINLEYIRLKKTFEDIIFSFNRDLQKIEERIQEITRRIETGWGKDKMDALLADLKSKIEDLISYRERVSTEIEKLKGEIEKLSAKCNEIEVKVESLKVAAGDRELGFYEDKSTRSFLPRFVEGRRSPAPLTATEMKVLEILAEEGEKTVPEIKERIGLTREHTARLMKSLYERGFVERRDDRIPYVYRLAKDMEEKIKKKE